MCAITVEYNMDDRIKVLERAKLILNEYGWCQGTYGDDSVGYCIMGATSEACPRGIPWSSIVDTLQGLVTCRLSAWNDAPGRTKEEVIDLLDSAINVYSKQS